jgi:hypothetical protein
MWADVIKISGVAESGDDFTRQFIPHLCNAVIY